MYKMNSKLLFILGCIPVRLLMAYLPQIIPIEYLPYLGIVIGGMALGMLYFYFTNTRLNAFEAGGKTWWHQYRLLHGMLLLVGSIYLIEKKRLASFPLVIDILIGLFLFSSK